MGLGHCHGSHRMPPASRTERKRLYGFAEEAVPHLASRGHAGALPSGRQVGVKVKRRTPLPSSAETRVTFTACRAEPDILPQ